MGKQGTRAECLAASSPKSGATMYILGDPDAAKAGRMMKCVEGEGLPTFRDQTEFGNLFIVLNIEFPDSIPTESIPTLKGLLPPPLNTVTAEEGATWMFALLSLRIQLHRSNTTSLLPQTRMMTKATLVWVGKMCNALSNNLFSS